MLLDRHRLFPRVYTFELCPPCQVSWLPARVTVSRYHGITVSQGALLLDVGFDYCPSLDGYCAAAAFSTIAYAPMIPFRCPSSETFIVRRDSHARIVTHSHTTSSFWALLPRLPIEHTRPAQYEQFQNSLNQAMGIFTGTNNQHEVNTATQNDWTSAIQPDMSRCGPRTIKRLHHLG